MSNSEARTETGSGVRLRGSLLCVGLIVGCYYVINFILTQNAFFPIHQDDYVFLGTNWENFTWRIERPVTMNLAYIASSLGHDVSFYAVSFLTVAFPALTLLFLSLLFRIRFSWVAALLFAVISFSHHGSLENGKYLGAVGMWSLFFGSISLILALLAHRTRSRGYLVLTLLAYALSAFSKEDFLLPPFLLMCFLAVPAIEGQERGRWLDPMMAAGAVGAAVIAVLSALFSMMVKSRFAGLVGPANGGAYDIALGLKSLLGTFSKLTFGYIPTETGLALAAFVACLALLPRQRRRVVLFGLLTLTLILPYTLIPNNLPSYRVFGWLPWMAGIIALAVQTGMDRVPSAAGRLAAAAVAVVIGAGVFYANLTERRTIAGWYAGQQAINRRMVLSIERHRAEVAAEPEVGIRGLDFLSPWSNNDGSYLRKKRGFQNSWTVFVPQTTPFYQVGADGTGAAIPSLVPKVRVVAETELCSRPDLLVLQFDANGKGTPSRARDLCKASTAVR